MKINSYSMLSALLTAALLLACGANTPPRPEAQTATPYEGFGDYWYNGEAELSAYHLVQSRYGERRDSAYAILIYVTEDFRTDKLVKYESNADAPYTSVLKLNEIKRFQTGIYDYSMMRSVFTPVDSRTHPTTLKSTFTSQDWCGQTFMQTEVRQGEVQARWHSYFEREGDDSATLGRVYLEDDVWTRARINPQQLPLGKISMLPSGEYLRLHHQPVKAYACVATLTLQVGETAKGSPERYLYSLHYPDLDRLLTLEMQAQPPYRIEGWFEQLEASTQNPQLRSEARRVNTLRTAYWEQNGTMHNEWRNKLMNGMPNN